MELSTARIHYRMGIATPEERALVAADGVVETSLETSVAVHQHQRYLDQEPSRRAAWELDLVKRLHSKRSPSNA